MIIRRIITVAILFILSLISSAYAQYPTSTPETIESIDYNFIDSIKDALSSSDVQLPKTTGGYSKSSSAASSSATIITWTGSGDNELVSNPENWSGNLVPQNGDHVAFDGTSGKNATWDLLVSLYSLVIGPDYAKKVSISGSNLAVENFVLWTGAVDNSASNPDNWVGNTLPKDGDNILFDGSSSNNCTWNINISTKIFVLSTGYGGTVTLNENLSMTGSLTVSGGVLALSNKALNVDGYLLINPVGTIDGGSSTITLKGNWSNNYGNFIPGTSTVILGGTGQTIYGNTTFYNLRKTVTSADTLYFQAGSTQIILNRLVLSGTQDNMLSLYSTVTNTYWFINPQGTVNISFARIKDMNNNNPVNIVPLNSVDDGNNDDISFGGSECVCIGNRIILSKIICNDGRGTC